MIGKSYTKQSEEGANPTVLPLPGSGRATAGLPSPVTDHLEHNPLNTASILKLAAQRLAESKVAFSGTDQIAPPPVDPTGGAGAAPPMDPAAMGGAPMPVDPATGAPVDPAMMADPAMAGAPVDPAMMDPALAGGMPPAEAPMPEGEDPVVKLLGDIDRIKADLAQIKDVVGQLADALPGAVSAAQLMKAQEESPLNPSSGETKKSNDEEFAVPEGYAVADSDGNGAAVSKESLDFVTQTLPEVANQVAEIGDSVSHFNAAASAAARAFARR